MEVKTKVAVDDSILNDSSVQLNKVEHVDLKKTRKQGSSNNHHSFLLFLYDPSVKTSIRIAF